LNRGFDRAVRSDQNHRRLPMMFPHMPEHVEPGHRLHFDVGDHDLRRDAVQLLDCFRRGIEWENLMALFPTKSHDDFHHRGFVIDNYDFSHGKSQRGEYFNFEKKKAILRISLVRPDFGPDRQSSTKPPVYRTERSHRTPMSVLRMELRLSRPRTPRVFYQAHFPAAARAQNSLSPFVE